MTSTVPGPDATAHAATDPASAPPVPAARPWWRDAVTYQLYIRSFADGDGDGLGDIAGIHSRVRYLADLGVDAVWINPWYPSPQADAGYDVADYCDVDPAFGDLAAAQALIEAAHEAGLRVLLDIVPNHTSDEHAWFRAALAAAPGSPERSRYHFRPGRGPDGSQPPNDWPSVFGGPAWTRVTEPDGRPGEWYLHLFDIKQPDLDWDNPEVRAEFEDILRCWFDRGADGFRIDVAHGLVKEAGLPDLAGRNDDGAAPADGPADGEQADAVGRAHGPEGADVVDGASAEGETPHEAEVTRLMDATTRTDHPYWDRSGVHDIYRAWRAVAQEYEPEKVFVAEAWVADPDRLAAYLRPDELHTAFDFDFVTAPWNAAALRETATASMASHDRVGAPVMWVLSNHDITRHVTRLGRPGAREAGDPLHGTDLGVADLGLGRRRARAALLLELALPGGVYLYQGEELGLEEVEDLPEELLQDPAWERSGHTRRGRDGCRVPLPWMTQGPSLGFGTGEGWLPQPESWGGPDGLSAQAQEGDPDSMLAFYRAALRLRRELVDAGVLGAGDASSVQWLDDLVTDDVLAFRRGPAGAGVMCVVNTGPDPVALPPGEVLLASAALPAGQDLAGGVPLLPGDAAVWMTG